MFKFVGIAVVVALLAVLIFAATRPDSFRVARSIDIQAPPEKIFALINDLHSWTQWSPWEHMDANMQRSYTGAETGVGTAYAWQSDKVGSGKMEIINTAPPQQIIIKLDFLKPFEAHNTAEFVLATHGATTNVTWAMYGPSAYLTKVMGLFFSMDKMVGTDFETGLSNLKTIAEK